jgi:hypothetical protein
VRRADDAGLYEEQDQSSVRFVDSRSAGGSACLSGELLIVHNSHRLSHDLLIKPRRTADRR